MKQKFPSITIVFVLCCLVMFALLTGVSPTQSPTYAYETECPWDINDPDNWEACLEFFEEQAQRIGSEKEGIQDSIDTEKYEQLSLYQQIAYINNLITSTELQIVDAEIAIEMNTLEINILGREIIKAQNTIDTLTQEINLLETTIKKRTQSSYKLTFVSPLEVLLDSNDFEGLLRRMKYLIEAKKQDRKLYYDMSDTRETLAEEQRLLEENRNEIQTKRNEGETQRTELAEAKKSLDSQRAQQQILLAESIRREAEYEASLGQLQAQENQANMAIAQIIMRMYEEGQLGNGTAVSVGDYIGFQGHTGYAYGSHLHFSMNSGTKYSGWGYFWGDWDAYSYITASAPLSGYRVTQGYHQGLAVDLVSTTAGNQMDNTYGRCWDNPTENQCYYASKGFIACDPGYEGWLSLEGEGAPIKSVTSGKVYYGTESMCGGKYAMVVANDTGSVAIYLHLQ